MNPRLLSLLGLPLALAALPCAAPGAEGPAAEVTRDGLVVSLSGGRPVHLEGPLGCGELRLSGDPLPGLLSRALRAELGARLAGFGPAAGSGGALVVPPAERLVVVVDAGHGGSESGATGVSGKPEKHLVLPIALRIQRELERLPGLEVVMTRSIDEHVPLWDRLTLAEQAGADLFLSVHANAFVRPSLTGVGTFFHALTASSAEARRVAEAENAADSRERPAEVDPVLHILADMQKAETLRASSRFAHLLQEELARALGFRNLGVQQADFVVLRSARVPSALLELGFITNPKEERALHAPEVQDRAARAVARAVERYRELLIRTRALDGRPGPAAAGGAP
jgi:N-acetylmuramoyl-L-alanine amidase